METMWQKSGFDPAVMASLIKHVCRAMERIAPLRLAEKWDNVSLHTPS